MDHTITIDRLPDGLTFPAELDGRIRHDPARRTLSFQGFMSKAEFDRLSRLHDDWGYRRAIEELFRICTFEPETQPTNRLASVFARLLPRRGHSGVLIGLAVCGPARAFFDREFLSPGSLGVDGRR